MPSKKHARRGDKAAAQQPARQSRLQALEALDPENPPASLVERARMDPGGLSARQVQQLQRAVGNRAVRRQLAGAVRPRPSPAIIQRLVDRKKVEEHARPVMVDWIRSHNGNQKYAGVGTEYEALLAGLDTYHTFLEASTTTDYNAGGANDFKQQMNAQISGLRSLCMDLTLADDDGDLDEVVVNYVLDSLNQEGRIVDRMADYFINHSVQMLARQGWDGQFANKTYRKAIQIAEFVLPAYQRGYSPERAFVRHGMLPRGMPKKGYKLHVSLHALSMSHARDTLLPYLKANGYMHKIVADPDDLTDGQVGKIVTIYPKTETQAADAHGFDLLVNHIETQAGAWGLIAGPPVANETPLGARGLVYQEANAQFTG